MRAAREARGAEDKRVAVAAPQSNDAAPAPIGRRLPPSGRHCDLPTERLRRYDDAQCAARMRRAQSETSIAANPNTGDLSMMP
jgi:hypothetical protein